MAEKKKISPVTLVATAGGAVLSLLLRSFLGITGAVIGAAAGAVISGIAVVLIENAALRAQDRVRRTFTPADEDATSLIPALKVKRKQRPILLAVLGLVVAMFSAAAAFGLIGIAKAAGDNDQQHPVTRVTVTVRPPTPAPSISIVTVTPPGTPAADSPSPSPSHTPSPSLSPSASPPPSPGGSPSP